MELTPEARLRISKMLKMFTSQLVDADIQNCLRKINNISRLLDEIRGNMLDVNSDCMEAYNQLVVNGDYLINPNTEKIITDAIRTTDVVQEINQWIIDEYEEACKSKKLLTRSRMDQSILLDTFNKSLEKQGN